MKGEGGRERKKRATGQGEEEERRRYGGRGREGEKKLFLTVPQVKVRRRSMTFQAGPNGEGVLQKEGPIAAVTRLASTAIIRPSLGPLMSPRRISPV
jgi:hypothetical protein